ncbi:YadA-like family protein [Haemophilus seminalis]|nr:YadA-like family protein [Haemophilus seminalis]
MGYEAHATQSRSLAIGQDATASANNAIALGSSGQQSGNDRPNKTTASAEHSVAIGSGAVANIANGIALGSQSKTTAASGQTGFDASQDADGARVNTYKDLTNNKKNVRTSTLAGLSIGDTDKTRQINHLAAGTADDDAVNVAQLKSVNLAFKGDNNTKGDVRLHDQRLSVVGATGSFITTKANDNKLEISTTQGTFSTTADGKSSSTTAGLATTTAVASAINESGWEVQAKGTKVGLVNPGDKVDFTNADNSIEIESSAEANGLSTIKFKAVTAKINTEKKHPVEITINNGITTKKIDKTKQATPTGKFVVPTGDDTNKYALATAYDVADKVNQTGWNLYTNGGEPALINPGDYVNFKSGNATNANVVTEASEGATISYDVNVDNTTIKIDPNGNKLTANTGDVDSVTNTEGNNKKGQVTIHKDSLEPSKTDSGKLATVDTVVKAVNNAKWFAKADNNGGEIADNAKTNDVDDADGQAMGAGDKLTLKAGKNLRVKRDGANFTFATDNDVTFNKVTSNEFVVNPNGKFTVGTGSTINMGDNIVGGVKTGVADTDAVNVAQLKANATTVVAGKNVSVDVAKNASTGKTFTVHSEKTTVSKENNSPIKLTSTENASEHTTDYKVGLDIDEGTLEVKNGKLAAKAQAKAIEVVESKEGDDNIAKVNVKSGQNKGDAGATYQVSVTKNDVKDTAKEAVDVRGSDFITVTPTDGEHLKTHTVAAKTGEITVAEATGSVTSIATATGLTTNKAVADAIAKSGFQLKQGEEATAKTVINPGDSLTFKDGQGTKAVVNANGDVTINANVASLTGGDNVTVKDNGNGSFTISATDTNTQASVSKAANSPITINATGADNAKNYELDVAVDGTTISKAGGTLHAETGAIEEVTTTTGDNAKKKGQVQAKPNDENKVATVSNVANAINKAKWFAKADNNGGEIADNAKTNDADDADGQAMGAGDKLTLKAGKNLRVKRDGANFTFATDNDVTFNKVTSNEFVVNPNGKFTVGSGATINMGDNIIHGVATGVADTDAVNVAQLKSTEHHITPATYVYNDADKSVTLTYTDGNGNLVKNTNAKIDLSGLASKIKDYSFKTNATGSNLVETGTETTVASGKSVNFAASDNLTLKQDVNNGNVTYTYGLKNQVAVGEKGTPGADGKPGKDGVDGSIGVNGKDGSAVAINGKDGSIGLNGKNGENGLTIKGDKGAVGVDGTNGKDGKDGMTRIVYTDNNQVKHEVATLDDGQKYAGDNYVAAKDNQAESNVIAKKANERLDIVGGAKGNLTEGNIGVNAKDGKLHVQLAEKVNLGDKGSVTIGDTVVNNNGITINSPADLNNVTNKTVSLTNQGLNNGGNKITNVAEGKDDTDAVNVKQLKDFKAEVADGGLTFAGNSGTAHKAKLNTTVNIKGGKDNTDATQFDDGKNVMTTVNNNTVTVAIKKTPEVEGINIIDKDGKVKVKLTQTNEGLKVSDGNDKETRITNVAEGKNGTDAVNVKQLNAAKTELTAGDNIDVRSSTGANGQTIYKVSANDTSAAVEAGSDHVKVTKAANTHKDGSTTVTDYTVDLSKETKEDIKKGVDAHTEVTTKGLTFNADHGTTGVKKLGSKVAVKGDGKNITTTANENGVTVSMEDNIKVNSVTAKEVKVGDVNINENGINAGGKRITNVAPGKDGTDAVNVNQLKYVAGNISNQINNVDKGLRAGIAGALASGGLYHVTTAGKSMVSVGAGTYRGQNALAVGYSRLSDNGKVGVKFTVNSNSQGHSGASASVGYQW